ncbi:MAG: N-6 DNA methylase, partial [Ktedonobacterales bacterium]
MSDERVLKEYLGQIEQSFRQGSATEHTYRPMLKTALEDLIQQLHITATNEPKRVACGAPDYLITRADPSGALATGLTIGYVEAKDLGMALDEVERGDQLHRYRNSLENLVLTNYLEFRWYLQGERHMVARLATLDAHAHRLTLDTRGATETLALLDGFLTRSPAPVNNPKELAERMARLTHIIRDLTVGLFGPDYTLSQSLASAELGQLQEARNTLEELRTAFAKTLIPDLSDAAFADMFAQTLAYGLFAARYNHSGPAVFTRQLAVRDIPRTNPFLRKLFGAITSVSLDDAPFTPFVDNLAQLLDQTDMEAVLRDFGKRTRTEDPIVHFYETFLREYDPKLRELRGVYYTPAPVVSYIVRSVDAALRSDFACADGLASDHSSGGAPVTLLDPACGTGTFLYAAINHIREQYRARNAAGDWSEYVSERLLKRLFGFELLMAPYAMAHLKLGMQLSALDLPAADRARWTYHGPDDGRLGVYLTNTLEDAAKQTERLPFANYISEEANAATQVKRDEPVLVVLGNPPYSGHSANKGEWITALLHGEEREPGQRGGRGRPTGSYFAVDGQPLGERNPKWLNDDYVKFIRFAQWRIERSGHGVLAFITNHGYLDNPTFRGMRQSLMQAFDDIYLLDLHGNSKKKERTPEANGGGKDENVFDIQQGVAIGIFIRRRGGKSGSRAAQVHHAHLYGERQGKYDWLEAHDLADTEWTDVAPQSPYYFFIPQDRALAEEYEAGWRINNIMAVNSVGIVTARDELTIRWTPDEVWQTVNRFASLPSEEARSAFALGPDARDWKVALAQQDVKKSG